MKYGFGVDLGGTTVKIAYFDETGNMLSKWEIPTRTENGGCNILPDIAASIQEYMTRNDIDRENLIGIGIGVPGPVNHQGIVNKCVNLGWGNVNGISAEDDRTCALNDMNCLDTQEEKTYALTDMNAAAGDDSTCALVDMNCLGEDK